jgi:hypothetical protein
MLDKNLCSCDKNRTKVILPNVESKQSAILLSIPEIPSSNLGLVTDSTKFFRRFSQSLQVSARRMP